MTEDTFDDNVSAVILLDVGSDILGIFKETLIRIPLTALEAWCPDEWLLVTTKNLKVEILAL